MWALQGELSGMESEGQPAGGKGEGFEEYSVGPLFQSHLLLSFTHACVCTGDKDLWEGRNKQLGAGKVEMDGSSVVEV